VRSASSLALAAAAALLVDGFAAPAAKAQISTVQVIAQQGNPVP